MAVSLLYSDMNMYVDFLEIVTPSIPIFDFMYTFTLTPCPLQITPPS